MTIKRSAPELQILTRCGCPASARVSMAGIRQVSSQAWMTMRALTCHAMVRDFAVPEGSGGARTGQRNRTPLENRGAVLAAGSGGFASPISRCGRYPPAAISARLPVPCRRFRRTGQRGHFGTL